MTTFFKIDLLKFKPETLFNVPDNFSNMDKEQWKPVSLVKQNSSPPLNSQKVHSFKRAR